MRQIVLFVFFRRLCSEKCGFLNGGSVSLFLGRAEAPGRIYRRVIEKVATFCGRRNFFGEFSEPLFERGHTKSF